MSNLMDSINMAKPSDSKIGYDELRDCRITLANSEHMTIVDKDILEKLYEMEKLARHQPAVDYRQELFELIDTVDTENIDKIKRKYFPRVEYDPSRE